MEAPTVGAAINVLMMTGYAIVATARGYRRRREYWTRGSWIGLCVTALVGLLLLAFMLVISAGVDNQEPWVGAPQSSSRGGWVLAALGSLIGGTLLAAGSLAWLAVGEPTRQFPLWGSLLSRRRAPSSPPLTVVDAHAPPEVQSRDAAIHPRQPNER